MIARSRARVRAAATATAGTQRRAAGARERPFPVRDAPAPDEGQMAGWLAVGFRIAVAKRERGFEVMRLVGAQRVPLEGSDRARL